MVGDGVNDVPALRAARLGIAQGSGAQMAKAIADVVLVSGDFAAVPAMVADGRRILRNIRRVTTLFVAKSVFAAFLILSIGLDPDRVPAAAAASHDRGVADGGIPAFFLALAPSDGPWRVHGFLREVGRFSVPAGVAAGLRRPRQLPRHAERARRRAEGGADGGPDDADHRRPLPRPRARGAGARACDLGRAFCAGRFSSCTS